MNYEGLINKAAKAISNFERHNIDTCVLHIENGEVKVSSLSKAPPLSPQCLRITGFQQAYGLTSKRWDRIGVELSNQLQQETKS